MAALDDAPSLRIGTCLDAPARPALLDPRRFNRHTFWCGQSGSGKTYALGVVLEQLLLQTDLPLLVLDPNADFVRLREPRPGAPAAARELAEADIRVFRPAGDAPLRVRYVDLTPAAKGAVLRLDPIADAEEYNALLHAERAVVAQAQARGGAAGDGTRGGGDLLAGYRESGDPWLARLAMRIENLEVLEWAVWSRGGDSVTDVIDERPRATVLDLGGFGTPAEPAVAALAVLEHLWLRREERRPVLIVIDEAHNLCPPQPRTPVERALTERLVQIAAEGRKFGLWLFLSTQRPGKIHPNVLSQCDNLGLLRINGARDLAAVEEVFGYAPEELVRRSPEFRQGQALFAGGFVAAPTLVQMGERLMREAGADVAVPLRG